jgi:hypothetical protein
VNSLAVSSLEGSSATSKKSSFYTTSGREVRTTFGIEPEEMNSMTMKIRYNGYALRPEIHRVRLLASRHFTNDPRWRERGKTLLDSLTKYCRTDIGYVRATSRRKPSRTRGKVLFRGGSEVLILVLALRAAGDC